MAENESGVSNKEYKEMLISGILEFQTKNQFSREDLKKKATGRWKKSTIT